MLFYSMALSAQIEVVNIEVYEASTAPDSIVTSTGSNIICPKALVQLTVSGGNLGEGAEWYWFEDGCGGTVPFDSGSVITIYMEQPVITLYCTAMGGCNEVCQSIILIMETDPANCIALPVNLVNFDGSKLDNDKGLLKWSVREEEKNTSYFLEKSGDGLTFNLIYNTKSIQTNQQNSYSYIDLLNYYANYYRLKIIDEGGAITYSNIVRLLKEEDRQVIDFFPNPTNGYIKMRHNYDNKNALVMINVLDIFGKSVYKGALTDGSSFELKSPDGMYILEATGPDGFVKIDKIVKISR